MAAVEKKATEEIEVVVETGSYRQVTIVGGKEVEVDRRRGEIIRIPLAEYRRVPFAFKPAADLEAERAAAARPKVDASFDRLREAAVAGFRAQEESKREQAKVELEGAKEAARVLGVEA